MSSAPPSKLSPQQFPGNGSLSAGGKDAIGLIGLGLLGSALAERLCLAGFSVVGFDVDAEARQKFGTRFAEVGWQSAESARAVLRECSRIIFCLPNSQIVASVIEEIEPDLSAGVVILDTTTGDPEMVERTAARLAERAVAFLDCEVGGSSKQVVAGEAILLCGGSPLAMAQSADLLAAISGSVFHMGATGMGTRMKLALNIAIGLHRAVLAESLAFAQANGIAPARALEVLRAGPAYSKAMDGKGPKMLAGDFRPEARLAQHRKDVLQILATGEAIGAKLPLSTLHEHLLDQAIELGWGGEDNSAVYKLFAGGAGGRSPEESTTD